MPKDNGQLSSNADDKWKPVQLKDHCRTLDSVTVLYNSSMIRQPTSWMMTYCSTSFGNEQNLTLCFASLDPERERACGLHRQCHDCLKINWNNLTLPSSPPVSIHSAYRLLSLPPVLARQGQRLRCGANQALCDASLASL